MTNTKIAKYQQELVDNLLKHMDSNPDFLKSWSETPFSSYNGKGLNLYNGINQINLSMHLSQSASADPRYYTFKQIKDLGLKLRKGSKGIAVQYFNVTDKKVAKAGHTEHRANSTIKRNGTDVKNNKRLKSNNLTDKNADGINQSESRKIAFMRLSYVFNAQDITGLEPYENTKGFAALKDNRALSTKLSVVINHANVQIAHGGNRAFIMQQMI